VDEILKLLRYEDGALYWRVRVNGRVPVDTAAGTLCQGYTHVRYKRKLYYAHRLIWRMFNPDAPLGKGVEIDHIDGVRDNNRIENLRAVDKFTNQQNRHRARVDNTHGFMGVTRDHNKWRACIRANGKKFSLGSFATPEAAHAAYLDAKTRLHLKSSN
jgi:hypothetical protein